MPPKKEVNLLAIFGILAGILITFLFIADTNFKLFSTEPEKPVPGQVFTLTGENLSTVKRITPVLVALYTDGSINSTRMARSMESLAKEFRSTAIMAVGKVNDDADLRLRASVPEAPAFVIYREGREVMRTTGEYADVSIRKFIEEHAGK